MGGHAHHHCASSKEKSMATEPEVPTGKLFVERLIHTSREKVFEAWTNAKSASQWMRPKGVTAVEAELDARAGGKWRILTKGAEGNCEITGEYRVIEPLCKLAFTWMSRDTDLLPTLVTVELNEDEMEPGCHLALTHAGFTSPEAVHKHCADWAIMLDKLALFEKTKRKRRRKMARVSRSR
jgi:uncharacterized protein YndB with AHSA1/START domain